jgi:hypothetical protein
MKLTVAVLLAAVSAARGQVPTPESVLGHKPGDDCCLATYDDALGQVRCSPRRANGTVKALAVEVPPSLVDYARKKTGR